MLQVLFNVDMTVLVLMFFMFVLFQFLLVSTCLLLGSVSGIADMWPGASCGFSYDDAFGFGRINPTHNWRCKESQFNTPYPK